MQGSLSSVQKIHLKPFIQDKIIHDMGAGNLALSREMLVLGAKKVIAIDSWIPFSSKNRRIKVTRSLFCDVKESIDVAFVSWPANWPTDLHLAIRSARVVIYLGSNMDGSMCGYEEFWEDLIQHEVLIYSPDRRNTLIVYDNQYRNPLRSLLPEERAAVNINDGILYYTDFPYCSEELEGASL